MTLGEGGAKGAVAAGGGGREQRWRGSPALPAAGLAEAVGGGGAAPHHPGGAAGVAGAGIEARLHDPTHTQWVKMTWTSCEHLMCRKQPSRSSRPI